jgi:hypothetical protein
MRREELSCILDLSGHRGMLRAGHCLPHLKICPVVAAGVFPVVISREFALALTIYTVATQLLLYYVRKLR